VYFWKTTKRKAEIDFYNTPDKANRGIFCRLTGNKPLAHILQIFFKMIPEIYAAYETGVNLVSNVASEVV